MLNIIYPELGYFTEGEIQKLKRKLDGKTFYKFVVSGRQHGMNCILSVETRRETDNSEAAYNDAKYTFLNMALSELAKSR